jgi:putative RNA 2'-phosphotransferase
LRSSILGRRNHQIKVDNLGRLLVYILGHSPDEFGLVPDGDGFVTYKELLQAIHEEPQWRYVRRSHINEVLLGKDRGLFQPEDNRIRVLERRWRMDMENPSTSLPKVLFTPVRKRAHPVVMEKGLKSIEGRHVVLSPDEDMALRIGMRRDKEPVLLEILASAAQREGALFFPFGNLFLSPQIPAKFVSGPPVAKETLERRGGMDIKKETVVSRPVDLTPGTFSLDITRDPDLRRRTKNKKRKGWKEEARKLRKGKRRW